MDDECIHLIWPAESCTICNPPKKWVDPFKLLGGRAVVAEFDGVCPQCQGSIEKDLDEIVMYRGDWVHADCARD